jgi:hypothetical protein
LLSVKIVQQKNVEIFPAIARVSLVVFFSLPDGQNVLKIQILPTSNIQYIPGRDASKWGSYNDG